MSEVQKTDDVKEFYRKRQASGRLSGRKIWLLERVRPFVLGRRAIDVGCGDGVIAVGLLNFCKVVEACDLEAERLKEEIPYINFKNFDLIKDIVTVDPNAKRMDFVLCFDVLEHIPSEELSLVLSKLCEMGDSVILNFPAKKVDNQIIEKLVDPLLVINEMSKLGLHLVEFERWGIWAEEQYIFMAFMREDRWLYHHSVIVPRELK